MKKNFILSLIIASSLSLTSCQFFNKDTSINEYVQSNSDEISSPTVSYDNLILKADTCNNYQDSETYLIDAIKKDKAKSEAYYKLLILYINEKNVVKSTDLIDQIEKYINKPSDELKVLIKSEKSKRWYAINVNTKDINGNFFSSEIEYDENGRLHKSYIPVLPDYNYGFASPDKYYIYTYNDSNLIIQTEYNSNDIKTHSIGYKQDSNGLITYYCKYDANGNIIDEITIDNSSKLQRTSITNNNEILQFDENGIFWRVSSKSTGILKVTHTINSTYDSFGNLMNTLCSNVNTNKTMYMEFNYIYCSAEQLNSKDFDNMPQSNSNNPQ